jgi:hypothetical protein
MTFADALQRSFGRPAQTAQLAQYEAFKQNEDDS